MGQTLSWFFLIVAAVLIGGFAWLEFRAPARSKMPRSSTWQPPSPRPRADIAIQPPPRQPNQKAAKAKQAYDESPQSEISEEQFEALLEKVRSGKGEGFSKRFEPATIKLLRSRGYNPDGSLMTDDDYTLSEDFPE